MGDGARLVDAIEAHHPSPFRFVDRDELRRAAARVDQLEGDDPDVLTVELMRTVATLGPRNGHTAIHALDDDRGARRAHPLVLHEFDDGIFVIAAERVELVGAQLLAVDGADVQAVLDAVTPLIARDNEWTVRARRPSFVVDAAVLRGLGIVDRDQTATFRLRTASGATVEVELAAIAVGDHRASASGSAWVPPERLASFRRRRSERHWVELVADGAAVHVGYNVTRGDITDFAREVEAIATAARPRAVVLDLRLNGGGDNRTYRPLLESLERLAMDTRLAVLTSRTTFSAAMQLVVDLERRTPAIFVGEPTGGSPNQYGDAVPVDLPRSGRRAHVATIEWLTAGAGDERLTREPDVLVASESAAYFAGYDSALDAALAALS